MNGKLNCTDALWKRFVPVALWLAGEHRRAEQVKSRVAVVEDHTAKREVSMFDFTFPNRVGRNSRICAVDH